ncbi:serine hydrolase [Mangrovivirga sp. M17]|uniref:Serine hydrolase n=1 Tax=Mangrovivirga halotolerans TaxID=2993936 RepID=A0ABT3RUZ0_9BACT|nr:serine hydrolase domain-containing protein [Mangrovivirga halotolerans]MCX2745589.1 serine hydrolase [Mangrovivirga halotolerans]
MNNTLIEITKDKHSAPAFHYIFFNSNSIINDITFGYQNIEKMYPLNDNSSFHAFSTTKTFTTVAILQLVENNLINLNDIITKYIPAFDFSEPVTIRHLLCHQSGIKNPIPLKWTHLENEHQNFNYRVFSDTLILNNLNLKFSPGRKYSYSNLNYLVLGRLIEEVSGLTYNEYISRNILDHLNTDEYIGFDLPEVNHATGYHANSWIQNLLLGLLINKKKMMYKANHDWNGFNPFFINGASYGGLISTPKALMSYCQALLNENGVLLSRKKTGEMLTEQLTSRGKSTNMCLGWFKGKIKDIEYYCHAGGGAGYYSEIRLYPSLNCGSVIMLNSSGMKDERLLDHLDTNHLNILS